ncbi:MAG: hypothetical protein ACYC2P_13335 [Paludibacteraceae bacterium]
MKEVIFMSIVNHKNKRTGVTYIYESESYWDKEKKQPRSKRTLIGKLDEATGEVIPTGKSGRKKIAPMKSDVITEASTPITDQIKLLIEKNEIIRALKTENATLKKEKQEILKSLEMLYQKWSN